MAGESNRYGLGKIKMVKGVCLWQKKVVGRREALEEERPVLGNGDEVGLSGESNNKRAYFIAI